MLLLAHAALNLPTKWSIKIISHLLVAALVLWNFNATFWVVIKCSQLSVATIRRLDAFKVWWQRRSWPGGPDPHELPSSVDTKRKNPVNIFFERGEGGRGLYRQPLMTNSPGPLLNLQTRLRHCVVVSLPITIIICALLSVSVKELKFCSVNKLFDEVVTILVAYFFLYHPVC